MAVQARIFMNTISPENSSESSDEGEQEKGKQVGNFLNNKHSTILGKNGMEIIPEDYANEEEKQLCN